MVCDVRIFSINTIFDTVLIRADVTTSTALLAEEFKTSAVKKKWTNATQRINSSHEYALDIGIIIDDLVSFLFIEKRERKLHWGNSFYWSNSNLASMR